MQVGEAIDAVHCTFERLLRWFYPPLLFFVLLIVSLPKDFFPNLFAERLQASAVGAVVGAVRNWWFRGLFVSNPSGQCVNFKFFHH